MFVIYFCINMLWLASTERRKILEKLKGTLITTIYDRLFHVAINFEAFAVNN